GRRALDGGQGIEVARSVTIDAPVERVWEFWNDVQNFPRFMSYVREVRNVGGNRSHWTVSGPGGVPVEWDAEITERVPSQRLSWRTVEGSLVEHSGTVRFEPVGPGATRVDVRLTYRPAGGALGHGVASLFGADPESVSGEDLARVAAQLRGARPAVGESGAWR
ncbi:MAG TPA: SRPBCC family protein, partial [Methylomirabilota bacterium]|nr:SRPBCC family protein [Methylomirabilota bacterium]